MESKKNSVAWGIGAIVVLGMIAEFVRGTMYDLLPLFSKQKVLQITAGRAIWNPLAEAKWIFVDFGYLADVSSVGIMVILAISLFTDTKKHAPGSGVHARFGTVIGLLVAMLMLPGATLVQAMWLATGVGVLFGIALGTDFIVHARLFQAFGMMMGISIWMFVLFGGVVALAAMAVLVTTNAIGAFFGYLAGCMFGAFKDKSKRKRM